jgi:hypothetical protein
MLDVVIVTIGQRDVAYKFAFNIPSFKFEVSALFVRYSNVSLRESGKYCKCLHAALARKLRGLLTIHCYITRRVANDLHKYTRVYTNDNIIINITITNTVNI